MGNRTFSPEILDRLTQLEEKYRSSGQDLVSYLDGLLHADYLTYWDYIHLDTLLSLQTPKTNFPDEEIFILYHQITELYFKLIIGEQNKLTSQVPSREQFLSGLTRINRNFEHLINSFDIMIDGMDPEQFMKFRMSLLPASGFQSAQFRMIEINATDLYLLSSPDRKASLDEKSRVELAFDSIYWKQGATELSTGKKTLTLVQFEEKYGTELLELAERVKPSNLRATYLQQFQGDEAIEDQLRAFDQNANVRWPLVHYKSAARYLDTNTKHIKATGGTNWQKYLPPKRQQIIFYPELHEAVEMQNWGKPESVQK